MLSFYVKHKATLFWIIVIANTTFEAAFLVNSSHVAFQVESTGGLMTTQFTHEPYSFVHSLTVSFQSPLRAWFVITHLTKILCLAMYALLVLFNWPCWGCCEFALLAIEKISWVFSFVISEWSNPRRRIFTFVAKIFLFIGMRTWILLKWTF